MDTFLSILDVAERKKDFMLMQLGYTQTEVDFCLIQSYYMLQKMLV